MDNFGISQIAERNEQVLREVRAKRLEWRLRRGRARGLPLPAALRALAGREAPSRPGSGARAQNA